MRRAGSALLLLGACVVAAACGDGGSAGGAPGGYTVERGGSPQAAWDPIISSTDAPSTRTEFPGCANQGTINLSDALEAVFVPLCKLAAQCEGYGFGESPEPDTLQPGQPGQGDGEVSTMQEDATRAPGGQTELPAQCGNYLAGMNLDPDDDGFSGLCKLMEAVVRVMHDHPECDAPIVVPEGLCLSAIESCMTDIAAMGCSPNLTTVPPSCQGVGLILDDTETVGPSEPPPGVGGGNGQGGTGGGSSVGGGSSSACSECLEACSGDSDCISACLEFAC